ncbi:MAG TPA: cyclopropane-fatty-acyl-phospholipid synthase family protein [Candidatus Eremiobacteraceae bacterium]|nr:cyclopropane-fatty-acyl-phospholipid synthase family protein [Candidatus Eremiobacteraceae bacterium]
MAGTDLRTQAAAPDALPGTFAARALMERLFAGVRAPVAVRLADGTPLYVPSGAANTIVVIRHPGVIRSLLTRSSDLAAGESLVRGEIDVLGDAESAFAAFDEIAHVRSAADWAAILAAATGLPSAPAPRVRERSRGRARLRGRVHSLDRDRAAIAYHYDVSNEFYALWLDRDLTYSCAYFHDASETLDEAQRNKYEHICRKLRLVPGERLLDIGCGWGGLVRYAAREHCANAVGITLSEKQADYARARVAAEGLAERCRIELVDYREMAPLGAFDKAVSVGMVEHVGDAFLPVYFDSVASALKPGGLFLNHGIVTQKPKGRGLGARFFPQRSLFIESYVFPDGELPRLAAMTEAASESGFELRDLENLREHYALTLRRWVSGLESHETRARELVGDETYNVWRFYMAGSAHGFAAGRQGVVQMLLAKPMPDGRATVPLTRADLYA